MFEEMKSTSIIYKPHCGKCGALIEDNIMYKGVTECIETANLYKETGISIHPDRCKCCGNSFNVIEIPLPKQLPDKILGE